MTANQSLGQNEAPVERVSTSAPLPFDPADLAQSLRVNQAAFARMTGVSRQTVSMWVKKGKIKSVYPDGTLDPRRAAQEIICSTDNARIRAKVFKVATEDAQALRVRLAALGRDVQDWKAKYEGMEAHHLAFVAALIEAGVDETRIEYAAWLAAPGHDEDADEAPLPLFIVSPERSDT